MDDGLAAQPLGSGFHSQLPRPGAEVLRSAAEIGRAHHAFLQLVSLNQTGSVEQLKSEMRRLEQEQALAAEEVALIDINALATFWSSDLGERIRLQAPYVQRELPFTTRFSPQELALITGEPAEPHLRDEFVIVQGVADLVVIAPENIWLVDFKTDALEASEVPARAALYEPQMKFYARALAQIYSRPVTECWLYFLGASQARAVS